VSWNRLCDLINREFDIESGPSDTGESLAMNRENRSFRGHIVKGKPIFKQHLYISSILFLTIITITGFVLVRLALDSLADRINSRMTSIAELNAQQIRDQIQNLNLAVGSSGGQEENRRNAEMKAYLDGLLLDQEDVLYVFIQNIRGEILWESIRQGTELERNQFSKMLFSPRSPRPPQLKLSSLSTPSETLTDVMVPIALNDQSQLIVHLGLNDSLIERRFSLLRGVILKRILLGASVVVGGLSLVLLYVLWLLKRAQVVEAEAQTADQLAYLGTLASGLAHEIRNPLNAMNLNMQMIEEEVAPEANSELETLLRGTKQEMGRLARLATNFLTYAKPVSLEKEPVSISELLDQVTRLVSRECQQAGIQLILENPARPIGVLGDRDLLKQAALNLLVNAQDAVREKGTGERVIHLGASEEGNEVLIWIRDSGPGISAEDARSLFKLFYSSKRGGTGLGLPIARKIVESHGGRIDWRNQSEGGAEFVIHLPA
jgi:signal transduction histidine kinase